MCPLCFDKSTEDIIHDTGICETTMALIDVLVVEAMNLGAKMAADNQISGDPLRNHKQLLAQYVSNLEQCISLAYGGKEKLVEFQVLLPSPISPRLPEILS